MSQLNIHVSPAFERKLKRFMGIRGIKTKSEAIRTAVEEALHAAEKRPTISFHDLLGAGKSADIGSAARFPTDRDLWDEDGR